jgi:GT2 family glycosyltransferase/predicted O-methyltransferase YrrM
VYDYTDVLAQLHEVLQPNTYLEIGVYQGASLRLASPDALCVGVDPEPRISQDESRHWLIESTTSDEFFGGDRPRELFDGRPIDLAFIDGMHLFEYALRDFLNAERYAGPGSLIVFHDCLPPAAEIASRNRTTVDWVGDVWKLVLCLMDRRPDLRMSIIEAAPSGLAIVRGVNPDDRTLSGAYEEIVEYYRPLRFSDWEARRPEVLARTAQGPEARLWAQVARLHHRLAETVELSSSVHTDLVRQASRLSVTRARLKDLEVSNPELETRLEQAQGEIDRLSAALAEQDANVSRIAASPSWKITAPLRLAGHALRRGRSFLQSSGGKAEQAPPNDRPELDESPPAPWEPRAELEVSCAPVDPLLLPVEARQLTYCPTISILMPVHNTRAHYLRIAVDSVLAQAYVHWEICVCDDGSSEPETLAVLRGLEHEDPRIRTISRDTNEGISAATNAALGLARGEFVAMLDHDDELTPDALLEVVKLLNADPTFDAVYTDQDYMEADGTFARNFYKPDWSLEMLRGVMYVGHLLVVRRALAVELGGFDRRFDNVQDFEFMLRVAETTSRIGHVPKVLYHWRRIPGSVALGGDEKDEIDVRQVAAVNAHLERCNVPALAHSNPARRHRLVIVPTRRTHDSRVSVIIRACGAEEHVEGLVDRVLGSPNWLDREILVAGGSLSADVVARLADKGVAVTVADRHGCASTMAALERATGQVIVSMAGDLDVQTPDWLEHLVLYCESPEVACVTPVLVSRDGLVVSAGLIVGGEEVVSPAFSGHPAESDGYAGSLAVVREVSAVSGQCFAISRKDLTELGGLNPYFATDYYQVADLSIRASSRGLRNLCTPRVRVMCPDPAEQHPNGSVLDRLLLGDAWAAVLRKGDPFWNPHLQNGPVKPS